MADRFVVKKGSEYLTMRYSGGRTTVSWTGNREMASVFDSSSQAEAAAKQSGGTVEKYAEKAAAMSGHPLTPHCKDSRDALRKYMEERPAEKRV